MRWITTFCLVLAVSVSTASAKDLKIATVDLAKLFNSYPGTQTARDNLKKFEKKKMDDLQDSAQELKDIENDLVSSKSLLSDKQRTKKEQEYKEKKALFDQDQARAQKEFMDKENEMQENILGEIKDIVAGIAKDKGFDLVLDLEKTVYAKDAVDLTDTVLKKFKDTAKGDKDSDSK
jgi:outer membrane protein